MKDSKLKYLLSEVVSPPTHNKYFVKRTMELVTGVIISYDKYVHYSWPGTPSEIKVEIHSEYVNGVKHGKSISWYEGGQLKESKIYTKGKIDGISKSWFPDGVLESQYNYINGIKDGECKVWYKTGRLESVENFKNGINHGIYKSYGWRKVVPIDDPEYSFIRLSEDDKSGYCLVESSNFIDGKIHGLSYLNNKSSCDTDGFIDPAKITQVNYVFGIKEGISRSWRADPEDANQNNEGFILSETIYKNDLKVQSKIFCANGNLSSEHVYIHGKRDGLWREWYCDGQKSNSSEIIPGGVILSHWYPNGVICCRIVIKNKKNTAISCYDVDGNEIDCSKLKIGDNPGNSWLKKNREVFNTNGIIGPGSTICNFNRKIYKVGYKSGF